MNEDFVTYELAVKLKEKGFDRPCIYAYCEQGGWNKYKQVHEPITHILRTDGNPFGSFYSGKNWNVKYKTYKNKIRCSAPTIPQVLRWLRKKKIVISILPTGYNKETGLTSYYYVIYDVTEYFWEKYEYSQSFETWEECELSAIEYVLDNLI